MASKREPAFPKIPGYTLESILGRGSMATVYRARQAGMDRAVAVKVLEEAVLTNEKILGRLMREARIAARFNHPHIVRALDAGVHERSCYFVMELVEGRSIRDLLEIEGALAEDRVIQLAIEVSEALHQLHQERIIHRDVKPANILVDQEGKALLADLGLAKIEFDSSMTSENHAVGTPAYMSPEQAKNPDSVDTRTDLFSLGATLYHMATGTSPFEGNAVGAVITKILYHDPPSIKEVVPTISQAFADIVDNLLVKDRDQRYASIGQVLRDLRAISRGAELRHAKPVTTSNRYTRWGIACGVLVLILLTSFAFFGDDKQESSSDDDQETGQHKKDQRTEPVENQFDDVKVKETLTRSLISVNRMMKNGNYSRAEELLNGESKERFARELGAKFEELPRWVSIQFDNERLKIEQEIGRIRQAAIDESTKSARALYRLVAGRIAKTKVYIGKAEFLTKLEESPPSNLSELEGINLEKVRLNAIEEIFGEWRLEFDKDIESLTTSLSLNEFAKVKEGIVELRGREPIHLGDGYVTRVKSLAERLEDQRTELWRQVGNLLKTVDLLPPLGSPEIGKREFTPLISRFAKTNELLGRAKESGDPLFQEFVMIRNVLLRSRLWHERAAATLDERKYAADFVLELLSGARYSNMEVTNVNKGLVAAKTNRGAGAVQFRIQEIAVPSLAQLQGVELDDVDAMVQSWLSYCDGDLVAAEISLNSNVGDEDFRKFLAPRLESAWSELVHVSTPNGKKAFRLWRESLTAFREGRWEAALVAARKITSSADLKSSQWYKDNRLDIKKVVEESRQRSRIGIVLSELGAKTKVVSLSPPRVQLVWDFEVEDEHKKFIVPKDYSWAEGFLTKSSPASEIRPDELLPLEVPIPLDTAGGPIDITIQYQVSKKPKFAPRCFTVSILNHNISLLSRLRTSQLMHLPLHGVEKDLLEFVEYGRATMWRGPVHGYAKAFADASVATGVLFEVGKNYTIHLKIDQETKTLALAVDGREVIKKTINLTDVKGGKLMIRAPMPHKIDSIQVVCGLAIDE